MRKSADPMFFSNRLGLPPAMNEPYVLSSPLRCAQNHPTTHDGSAWHSLCTVCGTTIEDDHFDMPYHKRAVQRVEALSQNRTRRSSDNTVLLGPGNVPTRLSESFVGERLYVDITGKVRDNDKREIENCDIQPRVEDLEQDAKLINEEKPWILGRKACEEGHCFLSKISILVFAEP